jgi:8-amino-7-oxononanoate synthase/dethiobiotin synthase
VSSWTEWIGQESTHITDEGQWRSLRTLDAAGPAGRLVDGTPVVSFAANDYLGLTQHPAVKAAAADAVRRWGTGSGASRLVVGSRPVHHELETELAEWKATEAALVFPTGYAANLGVLTTFGHTGTLICSDELNHASIIDGTRLAKARTAVFGHADLERLDKLLDDAPEQRVIVVSDAVFSMDGDEVDVDGLVAVCARHRALLVLDEAHAVLGPDMEAAAAALADAGGLLVRMGTLSKALGSLGGFVAGPQSVIDLLVNRARSFIFTTALSPADAAAALAAVRVVRSTDGDALRARLRAHIDRVAPGHYSPIVPLVIGNEADAVAASARLLDAGLLVPAIRPPTVAPGTSRLRVALSAAHTIEQVDRLVEALRTEDLIGLTTEDPQPRITSLTEVSPASNASTDSGTRPGLLAVVAGTGTEVGKTWVGAALARCLRERGHAVAARKPAQSFQPDDPTTDAAELAAATGEAVHVVCPAHRWYEVAMAPMMAAEILGRPPFSCADLTAEVTWPDARVDVGLVEMAGGVRSPVAADGGDTVTLAGLLDPDLVVLVADAGLGTINAVQLCTDALATWPVLTVLNRFDTADDLHVRNRDWLHGHGHTVVTSVVELAELVEQGISTLRST